MVDRHNARVRRPWLTFAAGAVVICLVATAVMAVVTVRRPLPELSGQVSVSGLQGRVDVLRDAHGVPQVYADTSADLFFAQGYVQAQDRFFEMDVRRHVTSGRLAELLGEAGLPTDRVTRTLGWRRVAERELALLSPDTRQALQHYADGVNAYLADRPSSQLSLEYSVLSATGPDYVPEPWTPADSVAWLKAVAWDLRSNVGDEVTRTLTAGAVGVERTEQLYPGYPYDRHDPVVTAGGLVDGAFRQDEGPLRRVAPGWAREARRPAVDPAAAGEALVGVDAVLERAFAGVPGVATGAQGIGSNAWAVAGSHTASGAPLLANDPHLAPSLPGVWYQMGLHCRTVGDACPYDVSGFTFSGLPGVVVGHNDRVAWGLTTMYADSADLVLEQVRERDQTYLEDGRRVGLRERSETLRVAGGPDETLTVRSTRHGPLLSDVDDLTAAAGVAAGPGTLPRTSMGGTATAGSGPYAVALQWTALRPGRTMDAVLAFDRAASWAQFRNAARLFAVPSQNLVYADVDGHIGYQATGDIPVRARGDGRWPVPGWDPRYRWTGLVPFEALPSVLDPAKGYVVSANQPVVRPPYPLRLTSDGSYGYRSQRISDSLEGDDGWDVASTAALQTDTLNPLAATVVPYLRAIDPGTTYYRQGLRTLDGWDGTQPADSAAAAYFNAVWSEVLARTFGDELAWPVAPTGGERWFEVVRALLAEPENQWWDDVTTDDVRETRDDILLLAMQAGRDVMTMRQARDPAKWTWGHLHTLRLDSPTLGASQPGPVEALFNRGPYEVGGGPGSVDATSWDASSGFGVTAVPSMRMIVPLDDLDAARWVVPGGQSGHAFAGTYRDQVDAWVAGDTFPWPYTADAVAAATQDTLVLVPAADG